MRRTVLTGCMLLVAGCFSSYDTARTDLRVRRGTFVQTLVLTGELEAQRGSIIDVPRLPSWQSMIKWLANDGDAVRAGDPVVELDNTTFVTDLDTKRQLVTQAKQELQQKQAEWDADLEVKQLDLDKKTGDLAKAKIEAAIPAEILPAREFEDRKTKLSRAQVEYDKSKEVLQSRRKSIASDRANLELKLQRARRDVVTAEEAIAALVLRAPRDGVVVIHDHPWEGRKLQAGDMVWVGFPIAQLPDIDSMQVAAALTDVDDGRIAPGMRALVTIDGYPANRFAGRVESISPVAQEGTRNQLRRVFRAVVKLDHIDPARMRPGLSVRVEVQRRSTANALLAPRAAIDFSRAEPRVRLSNGKTVSVKLSECNAQDCVVSGGLSEGQSLARVDGDRV